jgi:hypothetical protein
MYIYALDRIHIVYGWSLNGKGRVPSKMQQISSMGRAEWISRHPSIICRDIMGGYPGNYG